MPIVLQKGAEAAWLDSSIPVSEFKDNYQAKLVGF